MRKAVLLVVILLLAPLPYVGAEDDSIHLWSEQAPGAILLWDDSGNLTPVDPGQPIDLHLPEGNWTMVRLIDGVPQDAVLTFGAISSGNPSSRMIGAKRITPPLLTTQVNLPARLVNASSAKSIHDC